MSCDAEFTCVVVGEGNVSCDAEFACVVVGEVMCRVMQNLRVLLLVR